jgi:hypothetical protein
LTLPPAVALLDQAPLLDQPRQANDRRVIGRTPRRQFFREET